MKTGIHQHVFTGRLTKENLDILNMVSEMGFDSMDINIRVLDQETAKEIGRRAKKLNLNLVGGGSIPSNKMLISEDPAERQDAVNYMKSLIDTVYAIGSNYYSGLISAPSGYFSGTGPTERELEYSAQGLKSVAKYAQDFDIRLCIEPVNRYESYVINTIDSALDLISNISEPNAGLLIDTYHMNIEEKTFRDPILKAGKKIFLVHVNENDRGTPGKGHVNWDEVFLALKDAGYNNIVTIESFAGTSMDISRLVAIWRKLAPSPDYLASEGLKFINSMLDKYGFD
ncbi:MAG: sugar phosphate isomerase/epimerase family protein [Candidatus Humimicrobiaceae bacterium]